jgi:crossover junction endodeoxyribonuclease RuvC
VIYFGIDPGKSGSIAAIWDDGEPYPLQSRLDATEADIADFFVAFDLSKAKAVIERVSSSPQMGVTSAFTFGRSYGFLRGLLSAMKVPFVEVTPQAWQAKMGCRTRGDKNVSKAKAQQLWPNHKITHRNADALLIAEYARVHVDLFQRAKGSA